MATVVNIQDVKYPPDYRQSSARTIGKFCEILNRQGLIEPLVVDSLGNKQLIWSDDADRLDAALTLGWPTVIIAVDDHGKGVSG